ncbi:MAG: TonB-dependent receptor [Methylophilaceae bacterium]
MQLNRKKINVLISSLFTILAIPTLSAAESTPIELEEVMVTGELIDRPLSKTGISVEVLDEETLKKRPGLTTVRDVLERTTNVTVVTGTGKAPTIRGVDGTGPAENAIAFFAGSRPRLNWQIDGRPASFNEIAYGDFGIWDIDRIELLRGPQSTLTGRNSIAGTMIVKTKDPSFKNEAALQLATGNLDQRRGSGMVNIPLNDMLSIRVAADWYESVSPVDYMAYQGVSHPEDKESLAIRGKILFKPTPDTTLLLTANHAMHKEPNSEIVIKPFSDRTSNFPFQPTHETETDSYIAKFDTKLSDTLSLAMTASYSDIEFVRNAQPGTTNVLSETDEYVFEPSIRYENSDGLSAIAGLYFFNARQDDFIEVAGGQNYKDKTDTAAIYTETVIPLNSSFDLSLGLRYEQEKRNRESSATTLLSVKQDKTYHALLPKLGLTWYPQSHMTFGFIASRGYSAGGEGIVIAPPFVSHTYDPEYVWNYELFGRQTFAGGRIKTTQNIFYSRYTDMQLPFDLTPTDFTDEAFETRNADAVETYGAELGITYQINSAFDVYGSLGLLHTKITKYKGSEIEGNELLTAPDLTATAGVTWAKNGWSAGFSGQYTSAYYTNVINNAGSKTDGYFVANAQLAYDFKNYRIFANARNLFDSEKAVASYEGVMAANDRAVLQQPRTVMVGFQTSF